MKMWYNNAAIKGMMGKSTLTSLVPVIILVVVVKLCSSVNYGYFEPDNHCYYNYRCLSTVSVDSSNYHIVILMTNECNDYAKSNTLPANVLMDLQVYQALLYSK